MFTDLNVNELTIKHVADITIDENFQYLDTIIRILQDLNDEIFEDSINNLSKIIENGPFNNKNDSIYYCQQCIEVLHAKNKDLHYKVLAILSQKYSMKLNVSFQDTYAKLKEYNANLEDTKSFIIRLGSIYEDTFSKMPELVNDDLENFQQNYDLNSLDFRDKLYRSMIFICVANNSINCLKYLIVNDVGKYFDLNNPIDDYAIMNGNIEIIRLVEQLGYKFDFCLSQALQYNHNDIADWLLDNYRCESQISEDSLLICKNIPGFLFCVKNKLISKESYTRDLEKFSLDSLLKSLE